MLRLILAVMLVIASAAAHAADKLVTVTGESTVAATPDNAIVRIGVTSQGKTAREASDSNAKDMTAVIAAIKDAGIAERDIQTSRLSLQPQLDQNKSGPARLVGFQAVNQVSVRVRNIANLATLIDRAIGAGANEMSGIEFIVSDYSKLLDTARADAVADSRRKAGIYATAAGVKLGRAVAITDEDANPPPRPMQTLRASAAPISPGEQMLRVTVTVSYDIAP
jgi:uncharacterized protein YggE